MMSLVFANGREQKVQGKNQEDERKAQKKEEGKKSSNNTQRSSNGPSLLSHWLAIDIHSARCPRANKNFVSTSGSESEARIESRDRKQVEGQQEEVAKKQQMMKAYAGE